MGLLTLRMGVTPDNFDSWTATDEYRRIQFVRPLQLMSGSSRPEGNGGSTPSLFLGNLSMFVTEKDIQDLFDRHLCNDDIECKYSGVKIIRTDKSVSLGYGFVNMRSEAEAEEALATLNGKQFHGRPLQVNWAVRNIKKSPSTSEVDHPAVNSVHVKFSTLNVSFFQISFFCLIIQRTSLLTGESSLSILIRGDLLSRRKRYYIISRSTGMWKMFSSNTLASTRYAFHTLNYMRGWWIPCSMQLIKWSTCRHDSSPENRWNF